MTINIDDWIVDVNWILVFRIEKINVFRFSIVNVVKLWKIDVNWKQISVFFIVIIIIIECWRDSFTYDRRDDKNNHLSQLNTLLIRECRLIRHIEIVFHYFLNCNWRFLWIRRMSSISRINDIEIDVNKIVVNVDRRFWICQRWYAKCEHCLVEFKTLTSDECVVNVLMSTWYAWNIWKNRWFSFWRVIDAIIERRISFIESEMQKVAINLNLTIFSNLIVKDFRNNSKIWFDCNSFRKINKRFDKKSFIVTSLSTYHNWSKTCKNDDVKNES